MGLASAVFFLLLAIYVIYKVHWGKTNQVKRTSWKTNNKSVEEGTDKNPVRSPTANSNLSDLWVSVSPSKSKTFRQAMVISYNFLKL